MERLNGFTGVNVDFLAFLVQLAQVVFELPQARAICAFGTVGHARGKTTYSAHIIPLD